MQSQTSTVSLAHSLCLGDTAELEDAVLLLAALLAGAAGHVSHACAAQPVCGLKLLCARKVVVDKAEARAAPATELRAEAEEEDGRRVADFVHLRQLLR